MSANATLFGSVGIDGLTEVHTFTIENLGTAALNLLNSPNMVSISGVNATDFSVSTQPSASSIPVSGSLTFAITFNPSAAGDRTAVVSLGNSDSDENPYTFAIKGVGFCNIEPTITISGSDNLLCNVRSVTRTASGGVNYVWSNGLGNTPTVSISEAGTYTVTVTTATGCSATATTEVLDIPSGIIASASNAGPYFENTVIHLMATGGNTYDWTGPNGFTSSLQNPSIAAAHPENAGIYTVTVTNAVGCTATATTEVNIACQQLAMDYYLAYADGDLEVIAPISENLQVQVSDRPITVLALTTCSSPVIESVRLHISGTSNTYYYEDNNMPFRLHEVNGQPSGDVLIYNLYTFIARGYSQDDNQGDVLVGPDIYKFWIVPGTRSINAPTITGGNTFCVGSTINVSATTSSTFDTGNGYKVYLSDKDGKFGNAIVIGSGASASNISCVLPNYLESGTDYRILVTSTAPVVSSAYSVPFRVIGADLTLTSPENNILNGTVDQQAINLIKASNKIEGSSNLKYEAGRSITLEPGFEVNKGSVFEAKQKSLCF